MRPLLVKAAFAEEAVDLGISIGSSSLADSTTCPSQAPVDRGGEQDDRTLDRELSGRLSF